MTSHYTPPEDAFDAWLDALADGDHLPIGDERAETAAFLRRRVGMPPAGATRMPSATRAAIRERVFANRAGGEPVVAEAESPETRIVPIERARPAWRVVTLASAAVLALLALATIGAFLRLDDGDQQGGFSATASMLPFAPSDALASPTPAASCATDDTLLLMPEEPVAPGAFADLPFPVAWYADGTLTVERGGEVLREIEIGEAEILRATSVPGVIVASAFVPRDGYARYAFVNIATGETLELGAVRNQTALTGPYVFWTVDDSYTRWRVTDLRSFDTVDLGERFRTEPLMSWTPYVAPLLSSDDGTVALAGTTSYQPVNATVTPATPFPADLPPLDVSHHAILINGSLDDIRLVGPISVTSGAMALAPDGATVAWLAPSDRAGERTLMVQDVASGEVIAERSIDATYSNSLLFSADGTALYATHGTTLETIPVLPDTATPPAMAAIDLPDTAYRVLAASPDRTKLLLAWVTSASPETSLWVDLATGETREIAGTPGRMFTGHVPAVAGRINRYVVLENIDPGIGEADLRILDMATGDVALSATRADTAVITIAPDGAIVALPREDGVELASLATGRSTIHLAPEGVERASTTFALPSTGACAAGSWDLTDDAIESVLLPADSNQRVPLPNAAVGGWVPSGGP